MVFCTVNVLNPSVYHFVWFCLESDRNFLPGMLSVLLYIEHAHMYTVYIMLTYRACGICTVNVSNTPAYHIEVQCTCTHFRCKDWRHIICGGVIYMGRYGNGGGGG